MFLRRCFWFYHVVRGSKWLGHMYHALPPKVVVAAFVDGVGPMVHVKTRSISANSRDSVIRTEGLLV